MRSLYIINNRLLFIVSCAIPFINTWFYKGIVIGNLNQISILFVLYFAFAHRIRQKDNLSMMNPKGFIPYMFAFLILSFISALFCSNIALPLDQMILNFQFYLIFVLLSKFTYYEKGVSAIYKGLCIGFLIAIVIGVMQFLGVKAFDIFSDTELNGNTSYTSQDQLIDILRVWGPFGNALSFSLYLSVSGIVLFYYFKFYKKSLLLAWTVFAISLFSIALTISRMGFFAFLSTFFIVEIYMANKRQRLFYCLIIFALIVFLPLVVNSLSDLYPFINRLMESENDFKTGRLDLWIAGIKVFKDNIFWGVGPGNLTYNLNAHGFNIPSDTMSILAAQHVENYYLTLLVTYGIIPFFFYLMFVIGYFKSSYILFKNAINEAFNRETMPILSGLICFFINNLVNPILISDTKIQMLFLILLAIVAGYSKRSILDIPSVLPVYNR